MVHLELDLHVSFERQRLEGTVVHHLGSPTLEPGELALDTRDLEIHGVRAGDARAMSEAGYVLEPVRAHEGRKLRIALPAGIDRVEVRYATTGASSGLQWLSPAQTAGKRHPFLYSQSESIHARSWVPCIDVPAVRVTFDAVLRVPPALRAVMAAEDRSRADEPGVFRFHMPQPIPSYLFALAVGAIEHRAIDARTGIWAEPALLERAAYEFADTGRMMEVAEQLYGPYRWGRYDLLVMPPAFPLGGMENPRLTFVSPTAIAGDRSLVAMIAHELAHSWSGNLTTNATWNDFWLNEGFTVYFERRIVEAIYGRDRAEMEAELGLGRLEADIAEAGRLSPDTALWVDLSGRHPDSCMSEIPYEKGYLFLRVIEEAYGRERFDAFLRGYFDAYAFRSVTTEGFLAYADTHLFSSDPARKALVRVRDWVYGPGIPENVPAIRSEALDAVERLADAWLEGAVSLEPAAVAGWSAHEQLHFLRRMPEALPVPRMAALERAFGLAESENADILGEWLKLTITAGYAVARPKVRAFLLEVGRGRFIRPLYRALVATAAGRTEALEIYARARPGYHAITRAAIDGIVGWRDGQAPRGEG